MEQTYPRGLKIRAEIPCAEVNWSLVRSVLCGRFKLSGKEAGRAISRFNRKIASALNLEWFGSARLTARDSQIVACICEVHGADSVTLTSSRVLRKGGLGLEFNQRVEFEPPFSRPLEEGRQHGLSCMAEVDIGIFGFSLRIRRLWQALLAHTVMFALGVLIYVIAAFFILYSLSVFLLFIVTPDIMTVVATRQGEVGFALLAFLVVLAWIFGRAVSNVSGLLFGPRRRKGERSRPAPLSRERI